MADRNETANTDYKLPELTRHQIGCASCEFVIQCHDIPESDPRYVQLNEMAEAGSIPTHDSSEDGSFSTGAIVTIEPCDWDQGLEYNEDHKIVCQRGVDQLREMAAILGISITTKDEENFAEDLY